MTSDKSLDSATFDLKLLMLGKWEKKEREQIEDWIKKPDEQKKEAASNLLNNLIQSLLSTDCTPDGRKCSSNIGGTLSHLEQLLHTTRGGLSKKFYRDHLNHMLRVMLLANATAVKLKNLDFNDSEIKMITLAALFHDIAYPLSEVTQVFSGVTDALNRCYRSMSYPKMVIALDMGIATRLIQNANLPVGMTIADLGKYFTKNNHGLLSAMEFLQYIKPDKIDEYKSALDAIMFHDPDFNIQVDIKSHKVLALLIISDEMQDWGRPASFEQEPTISEIKEFEINDSQIMGKFVWDNSSLLSPLRQIFSKQISLKRIDLKTLEKIATLHLAFELPTYEVFKLSELETTLQSLFNRWGMTFEKFQKMTDQITLDTYQKIYYGAVGGNETQILRSLTNNSLEKESAFKGNKTLYLSAERKEILTSVTYCGKPQEIDLSLNSSGLKVQLIGAKETICGQIILDNSELSMSLIKYLVSILFVFDVTIAAKYQGENNSDFLNLAIPENKLKKMLDTETDGEQLIELIQKLNVLRVSLKEKGFFLFDSS